MSKRQAYLDAMGITVWEPRPGSFSAATVSPPDLPASTTQNAEVDQPADSAVEASLPPVEQPVSVPASDNSVLWNLGAGDSACVFLVDDANQAALDIANDLARALGDTPIWGWPDPDGQGDSLETLATDRLLTAIIIFGPALANLTFSGPAPGNLSQARITVLPDLKTLQVSAEARRSCWASLITAGVVRSH